MQTAFTPHTHTHTLAHTRTHRRNVFVDGSEDNTAERNHAREYPPDSVPFLCPIWRRDISLIVAFIGLGFRSRGRLPL